MKLFSAEVGEPDESLLNYSEAAMEPLVTRHYFEKYRMEIKISRHNGEEPLIKKLVYKDMTIMPAANGKNIRIKLCDLLRGGIDQMYIDGNTAVEMIYFKVDGVKKETDIKFTDNVVTPHIYKYDYKLVFSDSEKDYIEIDKKGCEVSMAFVTYVPLSEKLMYTKIDVPTRHMEFRATYKREEFKVECVAYAFMQGADLKAERFDDESVQVESKKWCLPGDGVVLYLEEQ